MQEICTSLMVVCALFSYCVICYIDTSMLICINHTTFNNDDFSTGSGPRLDLEKMLPRSGYTAQYTAQGNFRHYLFNLQEDVRSSVPPADKHKAFLHNKWNEARTTIKDGEYIETELQKFTFLYFHDCKLSRTIPLLNFQ